MAQLDDLIGALMTGLGKGRGQADAAVLQIAEAYKNDPMLAHFPVPRMTVDEVVIDLKVAITEVSESATQQPVGMTPEAHTQVLRDVQKIITALPKEPMFAALSSAKPGAAKALEDSTPHTLESIRNLIPKSGTFEPGTVARIAAAAVRANLSSALSLPAAGTDSKTLKQLLAKELPELEARIGHQLEGIVAHAIPKAPPKERSLNVLATVKELEAIPPEKVTTIRLTFRESDRTWATARDTTGTTKSSLVPL